jgi:hypothetical protein
MVRAFPSGEWAVRSATAKATANSVGSITGAFSDVQRSRAIRVSGPGRKMLCAAGRGERQELGARFGRFGRSGETARLSQSWSPGPGVGRAFFVRGLWKVEVESFFSVREGEGSWPFVFFEKGCTCCRARVGIGWFDGGFMRRMRSSGLGFRWNRAAGGGDLCHKLSVPQWWCSRCSGRSAAVQLGEGTTELCPVLKRSGRRHQRGPPVVWAVESLTAHRKGNGITARTRAQQLVRKGCMSTPKNMTSFISQRRYIRTQPG